MAVRYAVIAVLLSTVTAQSCKSIADCLVGEYCPICEENPECRQLPLLNEPCSYEDECLPSGCFRGMQCLSNKCRLPPWHCSSNQDCKSSQHCFKCGQNVDVGYCGELPTEDEPCGFGCHPNECRAGLTCNAETNTCSNPTGDPLPFPHNSCLQLLCSGYNSDNACQCDELCKVFGDCCADAQVCEGVTAPATNPPDVSTTMADPNQSCMTRGCDSFIPGAACNCDPFCAGMSDCCSDHARACEGAGPYPPPPPKPLPANIPTPPPPSPNLICAPNQVPRGQVCVNYTWGQAPQMGTTVLPTSLAEISAVVINQQIIYFGDGELGTDDNTETGVFDIPLHDFLNPALYAKRPFPGDHSAVEAWNGKLYAFSGLCCQQFCTGCNAKGKVQIYDPTANVWTLGSPIPWEVEGSQSSALINDKIYLCGGLGPVEAIATCGVYDPAADSWNMSMPDMPKAVHHAASNTDGQRLYIFGGRIGGNPLDDGQDDVQIYDPSTNTWLWSGRGEVSPMPVGRTGMGSAAYLGGEFYIMGGEAFEEHPLVLDTGTFDLVEVYHPARNTWRQALPMPAGLHGLYPVVHNEIMYVIGGGPFIDRFSSRNFFKYAPVDATKA
eukprot:TRINITY_DN9880_c0_g1_i4.p1 TRINITY_DN9880_c0_g1~~TRINITY_DN9880_c0_g1_i4.p1  ORF type:complete len:648 (+),score=104.82 TRINITY_DN9880_c0_g1_i4:119-1945(+)